MAMDSLEAYRIERATSRNPMSEVFEAMHIETSTAVAIKKVRMTELHPAMRKEVETEISLLQMLDHPNLIRYHAHFVHDGDLYLVMELAGGTLAQRVQTAKQQGRIIEEGLLWRWLGDVAGALAYLHRRRILHRDVKPTHMFLGETGQVKLGDFGLSKAMSDSTRCAFSCVGTPFYMSPEMVRGEGYSFSSDIWSLGCSLYELAVGLPPFFRNDKDFKALGTAICTADYPPLPTEVWSQKFVDTIGRILDVAPNRRPDAKEIADTASCQNVSRIHDFTIIGSIGRGKFSEVHRSLWRTAAGDRQVALKRIQIFEMDHESRQECNQEVKMLQTLKHSTIIEYLDSFIEASELIIVLELAEHGDLEHVCRQLKHDGRKFSETQVWSVFFQASDALHHMHSNRIMHRDIKPANIFMCSHGVVKMGDLGLGRYFSSNTYRAHSVVGTPFYMSPEVITGSSGYDFKSDVWGLGCVLYELTVLVCPFAMPGLNYYALGNRIKKAEYEPLPDATPERISDLCSRILRAEQEQRPDTLTVWLTACQNLVEADRGSRRPRADDSAEPPQLCDAEEHRRHLARAAAVVRGVLEGSLGPSPPRRPHAGGCSGNASSVAPPSSPPEQRAGRYAQSYAAKPYPGSPPMGLLPTGPIRVPRSGYNSAALRGAVGASGAVSARGPRAPLAPVRAPSPRVPLPAEDMPPTSAREGRSSREGRPHAPPGRGASPRRASSAGARTSSPAPGAPTRPQSLKPLRAASPRCAVATRPDAGQRATPEEGFLMPRPPPYAPPYAGRMISPRAKLAEHASQMARDIIASVPTRATPPPSGASKQLAPLRSSRDRGTAPGAGGGERGSRGAAAAPPPPPPPPRGSGGGAGGGAAPVPPARA